MNDPKNKDKEPDQFQVLNPFPEPQTIPKGWDVSELLSTESLPARTEPSNNAES